MIQATPFSRYRLQLTALASGEAVQTALQQTGGVAGFWPVNLDWTTLFSRFYPDASPYAIQVFESCDGGSQRIARVEAFEAIPRQRADGGVWRRDANIGFLRITPLWADRDLALADLLSADFAARVVRYHPGHRCTIQTVRNGRTMFGKMFHDDCGQQLFDQYERLSRASLTQELTFSVARPIGWDRITRTLWQVGLPGYEVKPRLATPEGPALARRMGEALGSLARSKLVPRRRVTAGDAILKAVRDGAELVRRVPGLSPDVDRFIDVLRSYNAAARPGAPRPIHGAPAPGQWLATAERLGLVDFDRFAAGDPELDVAAVLADLDFEDRSGSTTRALADALTGSWEASAGMLDWNLTTMYRGCRHLRKALTATNLIRPDGDARAARLLGRSLQLFAERVEV